MDTRHHCLSQGNRYRRVCSSLNFHFACPTSLQAAKSIRKESPCFPAQRQTPASCQTQLWKSVICDYATREKEVSPVLSFPFFLKGITETPESGKCAEVTHRLEKEEAMNCGDYDNKSTTGRQVSHVPMRAVQGAGPEKSYSSSRYRDNRATVGGWCSHVTSDHPSNMQCPSENCRLRLVMPCRAFTTQQQEQGSQPGCHPQPCLRRREDHGLRVRHGHHPVHRGQYRVHRVRHDGRLPHCH